MTLLKLILFIFLSWSTLSADVLPLLNISELPASVPTESDPLWSLQGKIVQVRGFWYPLPAGDGILAGSPQVKSCCLQNPSKIYQQLIVKGEIPSDRFQRAVTLRGVFKIAPLYNPEGEVIQYYVLEQASELQKQDSLRWVWLFFGVVALIIIRNAIGRARGARPV